MKDATVKQHQSRARCGLAFAVVAAAAAHACVFDTRTTLCDSGRRCAPGQECARAGDVCIPVGGCGNGVVSPERGEVCDDGDIAPGDGCSADCKSTEVCGNGLIDRAVGETCDDGNARSGDGCSAECRGEACGNGILDRANGEVCDDGNFLDGDGCRGDCLSLETCGNGVLDAHMGEECEHADVPFGEPPPDTPDCDRDCTLPACGDGHHNPAAVIGQGDGGEAIFEQCDDGGDSRGCDSDCTIAECGDGYRNPAADEECDSGGAIDATCNGFLCTAPVCGDGVYNPSNPVVAEECDTAGNTQACDADCSVPACGDGFANSAFTPPGASAPELCDDAGDSPECDGDCTAVACGDGYINSSLVGGQPLEECEDGNGDNSDACPDGPGGTCENARCGDGHTLTRPPPGGQAEDCDEGGVNTAECDRDCTEPECRDGILNTEAGEQCENNQHCIPGSGLCNSDCSCE